jgi:putative endonuclease
VFNYSSKQDNCTGTPALCDGKSNIFLNLYKIDKMKCVFLYIVECSDGSYYTGITNNPERRMNEHNAGFDKESYTYSRRPVILKYCTEFYDPNLAIYWEKRIKGWSHKKKKALIDDDWDALIEFSKRYKIKSYSNKKNKLTGSQAEPLP